MSRAYRVTRAVYRFASREVLQRLPERWEWRLRKSMLVMAQRMFPGRIQARSVGEFIAGAPGQRASSRLPEWAEAEVRAQMQFEPELVALVGDQAELEPYFIPWDSTYVGTRYAAARRQLRGRYEALVVVDGLNDALCERIRAKVSEPAAIIDTSTTMSAGVPVPEWPFDHIKLPAEHLDTADHCSVVARLVLQVQPPCVWHDDSPLAATCLKRHGMAMATVSRLQSLYADGVPQNIE